MTNREIEKYKDELATILKQVQYDKKQREYYLQLANGIKELERLADIINARKYIGVELNRIDSLMVEVKESKDPNFRNIELKHKCSAYEHIIKEISDNISYKLQTETMFNACVSAKRSCRWAAVAAIFA